MGEIFDASIIGATTREAEIVSGGELEGVS